MNKKATYLKKYAPFFVFLAVLLWATDAPFRSGLSHTLSATTVVFLEHCINLVIILPILYVKRCLIKTFTRKEWLAVIGIGVGGSALASIAFTHAFVYVNPSIAILLQKLQPFVAILLARVLLKESLPKQFWTWGGLALLAAYVISFPSFIPQVYVGEIWNPHILGVVFSLTAVILWGSATIFGKYILERIDPETTTGVRFITGWVFLFLLNLGMGTLSEISTLTTKDWIFITIMGVVSGTISFFLYYRGLQNTKASIATLAELGFVVSALAINAVFLDSKLTVSQLIAVIVLLFALTKVFQLKNQSNKD